MDMGDREGDESERTHLEELESFSLQGLGGQSGERRAQTLLTEAQGLAAPQGTLWKCTHTQHVHTLKKEITASSGPAYGWGYK